MQRKCLPPCVHVERIDLLLVCRFGLAPVEFDWAGRGAGGGQSSLCPVSAVPWLSAEGWELPAKITPNPALVLAHTRSGCPQLGCAFCQLLHSGAAVTKRDSSC